MSPVVDAQKRSLSNGLVFRMLDSCVAFQTRVALVQYKVDRFRMVSQKWGALHTFEAILSFCQKLVWREKRNHISSLNSVGYICAVRFNLPRLSDISCNWFTWLPFRLMTRAKVAALATPPPPPPSSSVRAPPNVDAASAIVAPTTSTAAADVTRVSASSGGPESVNAVDDSSIHEELSASLTGGGGNDGPRSERLERQLLAQQLRLSARRLTRPPAPAPAAAIATTTDINTNRSAPPPVVNVGARKPPLAAIAKKKASPKPSTRHAKRRDSPDIELDQSLFQFANCMRKEFEELNAEFVAMVSI